MAEEFLLDITQLAARLGLRERVVIRVVHREHIPYIKIGTELRFRWKDIEAWLEAKTKTRSAILTATQTGTKGISEVPTGTPGPVISLVRGAKGKNRERLKAHEI